MIYNILFASLFLSVLIIIVLIIIYRKEIKRVQKLSYEKVTLENLKKKEIKEYFKKEWSDEERNLEDKLRIKREGLEKTFKDKIDFLEANLKEKEKRYEEVNQDLDLYREGKIKEINEAAAEYEQHQRILISQSVDKYKDELMKAANEELGVLTVQKNEMLLDIDAIKSILEEERSKRAAINEEIRKNEEKEKYIEIHSVQLTDNEKEDIHFLLSLEERLHNKQALYKLVWSTYLQQAYKNTFNNILGNRNPRNVIYCIENINTGKKYIGKTSAEVSKRWTEHIKTSLNIGTIKTTNIHKALYNHWDEFIFYILAETKKDKLSEMEKYYINFYESDKYGYNIKAGG